ncbi:MAG: hypothetical protein BRC54_09995 [Cyanobacteria bacterium SW_7_48_12]|nr:MAG: hypothetical protein BRC54_09995 [Cyanobacteria bacterium SW_7_48_12]
MGGTCCSSGPGAVPLHAGSAGAAPRRCFPSGAPSLVVERTLAWISRCRRLSQDDDKLPRTWETFIYLAMIELMLKRVAGTFATSKTPSQLLR